MADRGHGISKYTESTVASTLSSNLNGDNLTGATSTITSPIGSRCQTVVVSYVLPFFFNKDGGFLLTLARLRGGSGQLPQLQEPRGPAPGWQLAPAEQPRHATIHLLAGRHTFPLSTARRKRSCGMRSSASVSPKD